MVPLWLLWVVVVALALPALFGSFLIEDGSRRLRLIRLWAPAAVILATAVVATVDDKRVSEDELRDATDRAARSLSGTLDAGVADRIEVAVGDTLGHAAAVSGPVSGPWSSNATDVEREERYVVEDADEPGQAGDGSGPAVCLVARVVSASDTGLAYTYLSVERGRCDS